MHLGCHLQCYSSIVYLITSKLKLSDNFLFKKKKNQIQIDYIGFLPANLLNWVDLPSSSKFLYKYIQNEQTKKKKLLFEFQSTCISLKIYCIFLRIIIDWLGTVV